MIKIVKDILEIFDEKLIWQEDVELISRMVKVHRKVHRKPKIKLLN